MIEARVLDAQASHCVDICRPLSGRSMGRLRLQFGGADGITEPSPTDFKESAENAIDKATGYRVLLEEKKHYFAMDDITRPATAADRPMSPPANSLLYDPGNGILLALYRLQSDRECMGYLRGAREGAPDKGA